MAPVRHILVVDHDGDIRDVVGALLVELGHLVTVANDAASMRDVLDSDGIDLIVLDASTSDAEAMTLASLAREREIRLVMISGQPEVMEGYHERADQLLHKPFRLHELETAVDLALASETFGQRKADPE